MHVVVIAPVALSSFGCTQQQAKVFDDMGRELGEELAREAIIQEFGPITVASVVGMSAPGDGPSVLKCLCGDAAWRLLIADGRPGMKRVPSPLDTPDPNRAVKITDTKR